MFVIIDGLINFGIALFAFLGQLFLERCNADFTVAFELLRGIIGDRDFIDNFIMDLEDLLLVIGTSMR
jgi:hypothetical protein